MQSCEPKDVSNNKDLEQNMMDLKIYQENLGDFIRVQKFEDAAWMLEGVDSILLILNKRFKEHQKLSAPFSYFYKQEMKEPIHNIRESIQERDTTKALENYRILINKCNDCHIDHEIDKEVRF